MGMPVSFCHQNGKALINFFAFGAKRKVETMEIAEREEKVRKAQHASADHSSPEVKKPNPFYKGNGKKTDHSVIPSLEKVEAVEAEFSGSLTFLQNINSHKFLAIDIDSDKIRYISGKMSGKIISVDKSDARVFPERDHNSDKALQVTLADVKANAFRAGMKIHVSFYSPDITLKIFELPKMRKEKETRSALFFKLQTDLPGFNDDNLWRYKPLSTFEKEGNEFQRFLVLVIPRSIVEKYMNILLRTGLKPDTLVPRPIALVNTYGRMVCDPGHDVIMDISYELSHIISLNYSDIEFNRTLSSGAANLEAAVHDKKSVLMTPDTFKVGQDPGIGKEGALKPEAIRKALKIKLRALNAQQNPVLQLFKNEIQNSLEYLRSHTPGTKNLRLFITGYGIQKENLIGYLKNQLNVPVFILTPRLGSLDPSRYGEFSAALGAISDTKNPFNVVPDEYKINALFKQLNILLFFLGSLAMATVVYLTLDTRATMEQTEAALENLQMRYRQLNPVEVEYQAIKRNIKKIDGERNKLLGAIESSSPLTDVMKMLSNETPEQIILTELRVYPNSNQSLERKKRNRKNKKGTPAKAEHQFNVRFSGFVNGDYLMSDVILINYLDRLKKVGFFKNIDVSEKSKRNASRRMSFEVKASF